MKKIKLNWENVANNKNLENQHAMNELPNHKSHLSTKCLSTDPVNVIPSISPCLQSPEKEQNCSNNIISVTNSTGHTTFNKNVSQKEVVTNSPYNPALDNTGTNALQTSNQSIILKEGQSSCVSENLYQTKDIMDLPNRQATKRLDIIVPDLEEHLSPVKNIESNKQSLVLSTKKSPGAVVTSTSASLKENIDLRMHQSQNQSFNSSIKQCSELSAPKATEVSMNSTSDLTMENTDSNLLHNSKETMLSSIKHSPISYPLESSVVISTNPSTASDDPSEAKNLNKSCIDGHSSDYKVPSCMLENNSNSLFCDEKKNYTPNTSEIEIDVSLEELKSTSKIAIGNDNSKISSDEINKFHTHSCEEKTVSELNASISEVDLSFKGRKSMSKLDICKNNFSRRISSSAGDILKIQLCHEQREHSRQSYSKCEDDVSFQKLNKRSKLSVDENSNSHLCHENIKDSKPEIGSEELKNRSRLSIDEDKSKSDLCHENREDSKPSTSKSELEFNELKNRSKLSINDNNSSSYLCHENGEDCNQSAPKPKFEFSHKELRDRSSLSIHDNNSNNHLCLENREDSKPSIPKHELEFKELKNSSKLSINDSSYLCHENREDCNPSTPKPKFEFSLKELDNRSKLCVDDGSNSHKNRKDSKSEIRFEELNKRSKLSVDENSNSHENIKDSKPDIGFEGCSKSVTPKSYLKPNNEIHHSPIIHSPKPDQPIMYPSQIPTEDKLDPAKNSSAVITAVIEDSLTKEENNISLEELEAKLMQASSGEESRWKVLSIDNNGGVFKLSFGPWILKCVLLLYIQQENPEKSSITFEKETSDEDEIDRYRDLGYKVFHHLVQEKSINCAICCEKIVLKLTEYSSIALKVEVLMRDVLHVSISYPYTVSHELDPMKITVDLLNDERQSFYILSFSVNLKTYPDEKIVPEINHKLLNDISEEVKQAVSCVEPGRNYLWNMVKAAHIV